MPNATTAIAERPKKVKLTDAEKKERARLCSQKHREKPGVAERCREYAREYARKNLEKVRAKTQKWREANRSELLRKKREWARRAYAENPQHYRERMRIEYKKNPEYFKALAKARKARLAKATIGPRQPIIDWINSVKSKRLARCYWCQKEFLSKNVHIDHITALILGGSHAVDNLCASCPSCNLRKNRKSFSEWNEQLVSPALF